MRLRHPTVDGLAMRALIACLDMRAAYLLVRALVTSLATQPRRPSPALSRNAYLLPRT